MTTFHGPAARLILPLIALFLLSARSALACSCVKTTDLYKIESADLIFIGRLISSKDPSAGSRSSSSMDPIIYTFEIERLYKGEDAHEVEVLSARSSASCGKTFREGRHLVLARASSGGEFWTGACSSGRPVERAGSLIATLDSLHLPTAPMEWDRKLVFDAIQGLNSAQTQDDRVRAIFHLGGLRKAPSLSIPTLQKLVTSGTEQERLAAVRSLGQFRDFGHRTQPIFLAALSDSSEAVQKAAMTSLNGTTMDGNVSDTLGKILVSHPNPELRIEAARLMAASPSHSVFDRRNWKSLEPALQDTAANVRVAVLDAIGTYGVDARESYDSLAPLLEDVQPSVRETAMRNLWRVAPDRARPVIEASLSGPDSTLRAACVDLAVRHQLRSRKDILQRAVEDSAPLVREQGWQQWRGWHDVPLDTSRVFRAMTDKNVRVRLALLSCLSNRNEIRNGLAEEPEYQAGLRRLTRDPSPFVRTEVIYTILMSRLLETMQAELLNLTKDPDSGVRRKAVSALRHVPRSPEVQTALERALKDEDPEIRQVADEILNGCR